MGANIDNKWTTEEEAFLLIKKNEGLTYKAIAELMAIKFNRLLRPYTVGEKYRRLTSKPTYSKAKLPSNNVTKPRKGIVWNQQKIDFVYTCLWNGIDFDRLIVAFEEQYDYKLSMTQLRNCLAKQTPSGKILAIQEKMLNGEVTKSNPYKEVKQNTKTKENKNMKINWEDETATRKQTRYMVSLERTDWTAKQQNEHAEKLLKDGITKGMASSRIDEALMAANEEVKKVFIEAETSKILEEVKKIPTPVVVKSKKTEPKRGRLSQLELAGIRASSSLEEAMEATPRRSEKIVAKYFNSRPTVIETVEPETKTVVVIPEVVDTLWTEEEDFDLLCNFYELSIDEARNHFNLPYSAIASRLELLVDSTEPLHQSMLMKAAEQVSARKQAESKPVKVGFLKRRKARKLAKKIARSDKKMAKLEKKLNKMRGE